MTITFSVVSSMAPVARESMASAVSLGCTRPGGAGCDGAEACGGRRFNGFAEGGGRLLEELLGSQAGLGDDIDGAVFERPESALRPFLGEAGTDHDRDGVLAHDLLQEGETVHAGHFDIEGDHVGHLFAHALGGDEGIAGGADDFDSGVGRQDVGEGLPDDGGIVNDQDANFGFAHGAAPGFRSARNHRGACGVCSRRPGGGGGLLPCRCESEFCGRDCRRGRRRTR